MSGDLAQPGVERADVEVALAEERVDDHPNRWLRSLDDDHRHRRRRPRPTRGSSSTWAASTSPIGWSSSRKCGRPSSTADLVPRDHGRSGRSGSGGTRTARRRSATSRARMTDIGDRQLEREPGPLPRPATRPGPRPPTDLTMLCTTSSPTPRPEISVTASLVEKPGRKRNSSSSASVEPAGHRLGGEPSLDDLGPEPVRVDPPAVVGERDLEHPGAVAGLQPDQARRGPCRRPPRSSGGSIAWSSALRIR